MSTDHHPEPINHLACSLSQCLHQLKSATSAAANTTTATTRNTTLDDLPDDVLLHILGYHPTTKEAIQASLISRRWRDLWHRLPCLLFPMTNKVNMGGFGKTIRDYAFFIGETLARHPQESLKKFYIKFNCHSQDTNYQFWPEMRDAIMALIDSWVDYAVSHDAQELELDLSRFNYFDFPPSLTDTKKVKLLRIAIRDTYLRSGCPAFISIKCLTSLRGSVLEIHSLTLKELSLGFYSDRTYWKPQSLEINCPNLTSLVMNHFEVRKIHFRDVSSLDRASVYFSDAYYPQWKTVMKSLAHVKHLSTQNFGPKFLLPKNHGLFKSPLSNVKHLEIRTSYSKFEVLAIAAFLYPTWTR
ncbi:hypothetical protein Tsubulata_042267 [Turnera subulata]|uniref:F-box domain-containing protein n=1 Tax=Turnera subulata TaxID=218843 RepID=A0A9Q0JL05_9ROSI|nr:hypothetical protein Tsubulata_042267 [Turnera subulata]